ncbi:hypothetical protein [Paracoccus alkanivorans]|uniref:Uncharacterized protein n=1 Tax=Paracoccus alkanivorans TaxID=2116655 RepID=A0A3M0MT29_9RHOB|nr:hypothetical protein [Paracoccus alkanivorans]RMC34437.1 hypothetical protein C9E81_14975 [Paracoccus alkanivorans]
MRDHTLPVILLREEQMGGIGMEVLSRIIAANGKEAWSIVFIPDELHIYIGRAARGAIPDPLERDTVAEFLVWLPRNKLHRKA